MAHNYLLLKCVFLPKSTVEKPDIHYLNQVIKGNINNDKSFLHYVPRYDVMKMALYLCGLFLLKTHNPSLTMRKTSYKITWSVLFKTVKAIKNKVYLRGQVEPKETLTAKCNVISWMGPWNRKKTFGKN